MESKLLKERLDACITFVYYRQIQKSIFLSISAFINSAAKLILSFEYVSNFLCYNRLTHIQKKFIFFCKLSFIILKEILYFNKSQTNNLCYEYTHMPIGMADLKLFTGKYSFNTFFKVRQGVNPKIKTNNLKELKSNLIILSQ